MTQTQASWPEKAAAARTALILVAHGERQVADPNRLLADHAAALAGRLGSMRVSCGVLNGEPSLVSALAALAGAEVERLLLYPFFMADGYFVKQVMPERISESGIGLVPEILPPLGLDPGLGPLMMRDARAAAARAGFEPGKTRLLIAGHGSKFGPASANATIGMGERLAALGGFASVHPAFLEEPPFLADALAEAKGPVIVSGFFASNGMHSSRDVPDAIAGTGADAVYTGPVGGSEGVRDLVAASVARVL